jgi:homoserine kinase type II
LPLYTTLNINEISDILEPYNIEAETFDHLSAGVENTSYRVRVSAGRSDCVVTVLENRDVASAESYAAFLASLTENMVPLPRLWTRPDGRRVQIHQGKPVIVSDFIAGECHQILPWTFLRPAGRVLAAIHRTADVAPLPAPTVRLNAADFDRIRAFADQDFSAWLLEWHAKVAYVVEDGLAERVLTHGDLFADNMIITPQDRIVVLDWENGAWDYYDLDLGMTVLGLAGEGPVFRPERARDLLDGYRAHRKCDLPSERLLDATIYAALFTAYHRYLKHEINDPTSGRQGYYREIPELIDSLLDQWDSVNP